MKMERKHFRVISVGMIIVAVAVGGTSCYIAQRNAGNRSQQSVAVPDIDTSAATASYSDTAQLYTVRYPQAWTVEEADDCCDGEPKDAGEFSRSVLLAPAHKLDVHGYGMNIQADTTEALARNIQQNWSDNKHTPETKTINGYNAQYVKVAFTGDAERYVDHSYLLTHNGVTVYATFRGNYYHAYPAEEWSAAADMARFTDILNSIKFL